MSAYLEPELGLPRFDHEFRMDYIKYCIPDKMCKSYEGMTVLPIGPYAERDNASKHNELMLEEELDQLSLDRLLGECRTWTEAWSSVREEIGPDFEEGWKELMWQSAVQIQGLEGLEMLRPGGVERWRSRLEAIRSAIRGMEARHKPKQPSYARVLESPDMAAETSLAIYGPWALR